MNKGEQKAVDWYKEEIERLRREQENLVEFLNRELGSWRDQYATFKLFKIIKGENGNENQTGQESD